MAGKKEETLEIEIPKLKRKTIWIEVEGTSPLITNRFSEIAQKQILDKQKQKTKEKRAAKDPIANFVNSLYFMDGTNREAVVELLKGHKVKSHENVAKYFKKIPLGFPVSGFKNAAVSACRNTDDIKMTLARGAFFIKEDVAGYVKIKYERLIIREDNVRLNGKSGDIRHRAGFENWSVTLRVELNSLALTEAWVCYLIDSSGFSVGVGDWRPEKSGSYGMFQLKR